MHVRAARLCQLRCHHCYPAASSLCRCGIPAANATYSSVVPPGGCITSCDDVKDRLALFIALGKSVPFISGEYSPQNTTAPASNSSSGDGGGGGISGGISPSVRRLLQGGSGGVWTNYTYWNASAWGHSFAGK